MIGGLVFLTGCGEDAGSSNEPVEIWGGSLDGLAEAYGAPVLDRKDRGLVEILMIEKSWKSYDRGRFHASSSDREQLMESLEELRDGCKSDGFEARLVVSAPAQTPFWKIREAIRTAAMLGICDIEFLVDQPSSRESAFHLGLPMAIGCGVAPGIEPLFVRVDADERVSIGHGASRLVLDHDKSDSTLPGLDERLRSYARAAEAASSVSSVQIHVDSNAPYQRMIDVLACVEWNGLERTNFTDLVDGPETTCMGMPGPELRLEQMEKPRAPSKSWSTPLGLAPNEEYQPKPPFDPDLD